MMFHDIIWYFMIFHDISRYYMMFHDVSWYYMMFHDISWYFIMFHDTGIWWLFIMLHDISWYFMIFHDVPCAFSSWNQFASTHPPSEHQLPQDSWQHHRWWRIKLVGGCCTDQRVSSDCSVLVVCIGYLVTLPAAMDWFLVRKLRQSGKTEWRMSLDPTWKWLWGHCMV